MAIKYSIIMPYLNRSKQFHNTLVSYHHWYKDRNDYEIIVVEDKKNNLDEELHNSLLEIIESFPDLNIKLLLNDVDTYNPSTHFNNGVTNSKGSIIVLTNPEIFHEADVLKGFDSEFDKNDKIYVICSCKKVKDIPRCSDFSDLSYSTIKWVQHSSKRNSGLHWCTGITKEWYWKVGGFDERFSKGYASEDDDWAQTIRCSKLKVVCRDDLLTLHQEHIKDKDKISGSVGNLWKINYELLKSKWPRWVKGSPNRTYHQQERRKPPKQVSVNPRKSRIKGDEDARRKRATAIQEERMRKEREVLELSKQKKIEERNRK